MKNIIRIEIKEYNDFTHPYFLATSPDVPELLVEGRSIEEVLKLTPEILSMVLEEIAKIEAEEQAKEEKKQHSFAELLGKNIMMQYTYNTLVSLQPA
jgi:predicted RNase H-like HicB family nuclease